jgi:NAD(P)-dependent dehydrogenase (short-subunit alcohol dehydrogenase family)
MLTCCTGTNSPLGIGRASAHQFAQNGARAVYICDFNDANLETHKRELASLYPKVEVHIRKFDAADEESVKAVVNDAIEQYGRLDIFFANAGIVGQHKLFTDISAEEFLSTLNTNVVRLVSFQRLTQRVS